MKLMYEIKKLFVDDRYNDVFDIRTFNIINGAIAEVVGVNTVLKIVSLISLIWNWVIKSTLDFSIYIYAICIYMYIEESYLYMLGRVSKVISNITNSKKTPLVDRLQNYNPKRNYSTDGLFYRSAFLKKNYIDIYDLHLNQFLSKNFGHLQFVEYKSMGIDVDGDEIIRIMVFQYTSKNKKVNFFNGQKKDVFFISKDKNGNNVYMCEQGIEFDIKLKDFQAILEKNTYINIDGNVLQKTPSIMKQKIHDGLLTIINIQTHNVKNLQQKDMRIDNYQDYCDILKDISKGFIKKD